MAVKDVALRLIEALEPVAEENGLELVTVELTGSKKDPTVRVYLDGFDGIGIDALAGAHHWIDIVIEGIDPFPGPYTLEVSSPGIDRPLRKKNDFTRFAGETVVITTRETSGRAKWTGTLVGLREDEENLEVVLDLDGHEECIAFNDIKKANVKGRVDFGSGRD